MTSRPETPPSASAGSAAGKTAVTAGAGPASAGQAPAGWVPVPCGTAGRRWVGPVLDDPATASAVAERAARLAADLAAPGFPAAQLERLRELVGPVPRAGQPGGGAGRDAA